MSLLYKAKRLGKDGKVFELLKFRTMVEGADKMGGSSTSDDDPRITKIGKFLRKTKLDEILGLGNVLRGEMSLIGWRPESQEYLHTIPQEVLATKPGLIGWATLDDMDEGAELAGKEDPDKYYEEVILPRKRELELYYVRNKSLWFDIKIIALTIWKLISRR